MQSPAWEMVTLLVLEARQEGCLGVLYPKRASEHPAAFPINGVHEVAT